MRRTIPAGLLIPLVALATRFESPAPPSPPEVGAKAPAFRLNDHEGNAVGVGGAADGYTILAFFPKAMTPG